jgi:hypothetical protein
MSSYKSKRFVKIVAVIAMTIAVSLFIYLFLWGKFFPYSPLKISFDKFELSNVIIYVQHGVHYDDYSLMDAYPPAVEKWHDLSFLAKPKIFIFRDKDSYLKRSNTKARFCAYPNGCILTSPWALQEAKEGKISCEIYLKHELSHVLLYQHMGIIEAYIQYPRWLLEGIAMCSAEQMGTSLYPGKEQTYACIHQGDFMPPSYYKSRNEDSVSLNVQNRIGFLYSEFGCIVDYLILSFGKEKFLNYMKELLRDSDHDRVFQRIYGIDFDDFLGNFKKQDVNPVHMELSH